MLPRNLPPLAPGSISRTPILALCIVALVVAMLGLVGCSTEQIDSLKAARDNAAAQVAELETQFAEVDSTIAQLDEVIATAPADSSEHQQAAAAREQLLKIKPRIDQGIAQAKQLLDAAERNLASVQADDAGSAIAATGATIGAVAPPPWNILITAGATLIGGIVTGVATQRRKAQQTKDAARSIVKAIEETKDNEGRVYFDDPMIKSELRSRMSEEAKRLVEEARAQIGPILRPIETSN